MEIFKNSEGDNRTFTVFDAENQPATESPGLDQLCKRWHYRDLIKCKPTYSYMYLYDCNLTSEQLCELLKHLKYIAVYGNNDIVIDIEYLLDNMDRLTQILFTSSVLLSYPYDYIRDHYNNKYVVNISSNGIYIRRR